MNECKECKPSYAKNGKERDRLEVEMYKTDKKEMEDVGKYGDLMAK